MSGLFEDTGECISFNLPDAGLDYYPKLFREEADYWFERLIAETPWKQDDILIYGKQHKQPRLTALYGNEGKLYSYSNIVMVPHAWTPLLTLIREKVEEISGANFSTVLLNLYRSGQDSNGWHADNEKELGRDPVIASLSLGAVRSFHLKHNTLENRLKLQLEHGSLLIMKGSMQHYWKHQVPKTARETGPRINLTFRLIK